MKNLNSILASLAALGLAGTVSAQVALSNRGFDETGAFRLTVSGPSEIEVSHDLQNWSKFATVAQASGLDDLASRQMDRRFYRVPGGGPVVGYLKVTIPPGKIALLGNSFGIVLRPDTAEGRRAIFGVTNPMMKFSSFTNGNFVAHSLDPASGNWQPPFRPIRPQEGFMVQNTGSNPLTVRMSGPVHQGRVQTTVPAGSSLLVSPFPSLGPAAMLANAPAPDGTQMMWFDEQTDKYQTFTFNAAPPPGKWEPSLPNVPPGRALTIKTPKSFSITSTGAAPAAAAH